MCSENRISRWVFVAAVITGFILLSFSVALAGDCGPADGERLSADGVLELLSRQRDRFLEQGRFADVFAVLYHATTDEMIRESKSMAAEDAALLERQIVLFYEAYESNRRAFDTHGASAVEPHWKAYYRDAGNLEKKKDVTGFDVMWLMLNGVDAHLNDLPRSLRYQLRERPNITDRLKMIYFRLDTIFPAVVRSLDADILAAFGKRGSPAPQFATMNIGPVYVTHARLRAWEAATGTGKLRAKGPQPRLCKEG